MGYNYKCNKCSGYHPPHSCCPKPACPPPKSPCPPQTDDCNRRIIPDPFQNPNFADRFIIQRISEVPGDGCNPVINCEIVAADGHSLDTLLCRISNMRPDEGIIDIEDIQDYYFEAIKDNPDDPEDPTNGECVKLKLPLPLNLNPGNIEIQTIPFVARTTLGSNEFFNSTYSRQNPSKKVLVMVNIQAYVGGVIEPALRDRSSLLVSGTFDASFNGAPNIQIDDVYIHDQSHDLLTGQGSPSGGGGVAVNQSNTYFFVSDQDDTTVDLTVGINVASLGGGSGLEPSVYFIQVRAPSQITYVEI